jgi:UDP-MurNAc hydroxylase
MINLKLQMKIKLYRSSTVGLEFDNFKVLQDPWLTDGEYFGSWSHFPHFDIEKNIDEINNYDAMYISHIHPDHSSDKTLIKINKNIPIYIHQYHSKFLKFKLERYGFKVIELLNGVNYQISKNVNLRIFASDNCKPDLCYKFFGCANLLNNASGSQQLDTLAIFDDSKNVLINVNDCPYDLAKSTFKDIKKNYKIISALLCGYQVSGPYPQCFDNLNNNQKIKEGERVSIEALNKALGFINDLKPNYFLPFAGTYALSGNLSKLDHLRGAYSVNDAYNFLSKKQNYSKPMLLNPGDYFDLVSNKTSNPYKPINKIEYEDYLKNTLNNRKLDYETDAMPDLDEIINLSKSAYLKFLDKKLALSIEIKTDIYIEIYDKFIKLPKNDQEGLQIIQKKKLKNDTKYIIYKTDPRLLRLLLKGPRYAHWNNAEIGSHIRFFRNPNVYERNIFGGMCYLHN